MEIYPSIEMIDLALHLKKENVLIFSDFHLGYEQGLLKKGIFLPFQQFEDTHARVKKILGKDMFTSIVVTGDFKHEFGIISETEWRHALQIIDLFLEHTSKVILIEGNHDPVLGPIARKRNVRLVSYLVYGEIFVCHGDVIPTVAEFEKSTIVIIGHEHPAIGLKEGAKREVYKCFLKGMYEKKTLLVVPSFNLMTLGTDVLRDRLLSPFLQHDLSNFDIFVNENGMIYPFGKVKTLLK